MAGLRATVWRSDAVHTRRESRQDHDELRPTDHAREEARQVFSSYHHSKLCKGGKGMVSLNRQTDVNVIAVTQIENLSEVKPGYVPLTVATVCMNAQTDKLINLATFAKYMEAAAERNVHLIVFPEIALQQNPGWGRISYKPTQEELAYVQDTAEPILGASTTWLTEKASDLGIYIVFGMTELGEDGGLYNSSVFLGPKGVLGGIHRKHKLWEGNENRCHRGQPGV